MKSKLIVLALVATLLAGVMAPSFAGRANATVPAVPAASGAQAHAAIFDKTRFLLHLGIAYYAFHHWVYTPYKNGAFASGSSGRVKAIAKAALAVALTYHELKVAYGIANGSSSKTLQALVAPLNKFLNLANTEANRLKSGNFSSTDITNLSKQATSFSSMAAENGYTIKDHAPLAPVPGLS